MEGQTQKTKCPTWSDHEFGAPVLIGAGNHPINGRWTRHRTKCGLCDREYVETKYVNAQSPYGTAVGQVHEGEQ